MSLLESVSTAVHSVLGLDDVDVDRPVDAARANIRRVLRDASRGDAVTQEFFAEVLRDASDFDPDRDNAQAWLLTRAHQRALSGLTSGHAASC